MSDQHNEPLNSMWSPKIRRLEMEMEFSSEMDQIFQIVLCGGGIEGGNNVGNQQQVNDNRDSTNDESDIDNLWNKSLEKNNWINVT